MSISNKKRVFSLFCVIIFFSALFYICLFDKNQTNDRNALVSDKKRVYNILIAGIDDTGTNSDVIIFASYDTSERSLGILQIPRDTAVFSSDGNAKRINSVYGSALASCDGKKNASKIASERTFDELSSLFGLRLDYYVFADLSAFRDAIDAVGGISIDIPYDMSYTDPEQGLVIALKQGTQRLDGASAEQFVRFRSGYIEGDLGRLDAQKLFFSAFIKTAMTEMTPQKALAVAVRSAGCLHTNMPIDAMTRIVSDLYSNRAELKVSYMTLPGEALKYKGPSSQGARWYYVLNRAASFEMLERYFPSGSLKSEEDFDRNGRFYTPYDEAISNVYFERNFDYKIYTEEDLKNIRPLRSK